MIHSRIDAGVIKGWLAGPWDASFPVPVGYATAGVDEPHRHSQMFEIYMVARGQAKATVASREVELGSGDILIVHPGEEHTFSWSTHDYLHFVVQAPYAPGDKTLAH